MNDDNRVRRRDVLKNVGTAGTAGLAITVAASTPSAAQQGGGVYYGCASGSFETGDVVARTAASPPLVFRVRWPRVADRSGSTSDTSSTSRMGIRAPWFCIGPRAHPGLRSAGVTRSRDGGRVTRAVGLLSALTSGASFGLTRAGRPRFDPARGPDVGSRLERSRLEAELPPDRRRPPSTASPPRRG